MVTPYPAMQVIDDAGNECWGQGGFLVVVSSCGVFLWCLVVVSCGGVLWWCLLVVCGDCAPWCDTVGPVCVASLVVSLIAMWYVWLSLWRTGADHDLRETRRIWAMRGEASRIIHPESLMRPNIRSDAK